MIEQINVGWGFLDYKPFRLRTDDLPLAVSRAYTTMSRARERNRVAFGALIAEGTRLFDQGVRSAHGPLEFWDDQRGSGTATYFLRPPEVEGGPVGVSGSVSRESELPSGMVEALELHRRWRRLCETRSLLDSLERLAYLLTARLLTERYGSASAPAVNVVVVDSPGRRALWGVQTYSQPFGGSGRRWAEITTLPDELHVLTIHEASGRADAHEQS